VSDLVPTIYEILGIEAPTSYRGWEQLPVSGTSLAYSFGAPEEPSRKHVQYFEMMGHRGIYADGWKAVTRHQPGVPFDDDDWELYHLDADRSECHDLAAAEPERVTALVDLWWREAEAYGVLPLDDRTIELFMTRYRDGSPHPTDRHYTYYPPMSPLPGQVAPALGGRGWAMDATIDRPEGAGGVLYASGNENSGISLFVQDERLVLDYNCFGDHHVVVSEAEVPVGPSVVGARCDRTGRGGAVTLVVGGAPSGSLELPFLMTLISSVGPSVGYDHGSPVSPRYQAPFPFEGTLHRLDVQVTRGPASAGAAEAAERAAMSQQ
jgi:arylsulfatase